MLIELYRVLILLKGWREMYIKEIKTISNYRNLSGPIYGFDKDLNYIIGENNIGKTNILGIVKYNTIRR